MLVVGLAAAFVLFALLMLALFWRSAWWIDGPPTSQSAPCEQGLERHDAPVLSSALAGSSET